jgi:hypothetical protein
MRLPFTTASPTAHALFGLWFAVSKSMAAKVVMVIR